MHKLFIKFTSLILLIFLLVQVDLAGQKLKYKFEKGKSYKYSTSVNNKITGQAMGQEFSITSGAFFDYSMTNTEFKDGVYSLVVTFEKFDLKLNMPMMGFNDSTISMTDFIGKRVKILVTELGKTISVVTIDTIKPSRIQAMANLNPSDLFRHILIQLPEKELDINSTWKNDVPDTTKRGGALVIAKQNIELKVVGTEKQNNLECWKIAINGTNTIEGSGSQGGNDITIDGSSKVSGTAFMAPKEGILVSVDNTVDMDMTTTVTGANTGASTMVINTVVKSVLVK